MIKGSWKTYQKNNNKLITKDSLRSLVNEEIKFDQIRLIGEDGSKLGIFSKKEALLKSKELGLDLLLISSNSIPSVCKMVELDKYIYEKNSELKSNLRKQKSILKESKFNYSISDDSIDIKAKQIVSWFSKSNFTIVKIHFLLKNISYKERMEAISSGKAYKKSLRIFDIIKDKFSSNKENKNSEIYMEKEASSNRGYSFFIKKRKV